MQDGAEHTDQVKLQKQRASRRKRILENAQNRLEKLKNPQWRHSKEQTEPQKELTPVKFADEVEVGDPPDEIIPRQTIQQHSTVTQASSSIHEQKVTLLNQTVTAVQANVSIKARLTIALMCGALLTLYSTLTGAAVSYIVTMGAVNCILYVILSFFVKPDTTINPLAWLELVKLPLSFFHRLLPVVFENVCLSLYLLAYFIQDMLVMLFSAVVCLSIANVLYS